MSIRSAPVAGTPRPPGGPTRFEQVLACGQAYPRTVLEPWARVYEEREAERKKQPPTEDEKRAAEAKRLAAAAAAKEARRAAAREAERVRNEEARRRAAQAAEARAEEAKREAGERRAEEQARLLGNEPDDDLDDIELPGDGTPLGPDGLPPRDGLVTTTVAHFNMGSEV